MSPPGCTWLWRQEMPHTLFQSPQSRNRRWQPGALSVTVTSPKTFPVTEGVKLTLIVQVSPAARLAGQLLVSLKLPTATIEEIASAPVPLFFRVTGLAALLA